MKGRSPASVRVAFRRRWPVVDPLNPRRRKPARARRFRLRPLNALAYGFLAMVLALATFRTVTAKSPSTPPPVSSLAEQAAFEEVVRQEWQMRTQAARNFPGDAWSQNDDFHHDEVEKAKRAAFRLNLDLPDVFRAIDDGLHGRWPLPRDARVTATVPPCRPRLDY